MISYYQRCNVDFVRIKAPAFTPHLDYISHPYDLLHERLQIISAIAVFVLSLVRCSFFFHLFELISAFPLLYSFFSGY